METLEAVLKEEQTDPSGAPGLAGSPAKAPSRGPRSSHEGPWVTVARVLLNLDEFVTRE